MVINYIEEKPLICRVTNNRRQRMYSMSAYSDARDEAFWRTICCNVQIIQKLLISQPAFIARCQTLFAPIFIVDYSSFGIEQLSTYCIDNIRSLRLVSKVMKSYQRLQIAGDNPAAPSWYLEAGYWSSFTTEIPK